MRSLCCVVLLVACGPKVSTSPSAFDEDLGKDKRTQPTDEVTEVPRPEAPPGKGLRTGSIERAHLIAVLDAGVGTFLRQVEVTPRLAGERFVGWQLVQLVDRTGPLVDIDVLPGDVLLAINDQPIARPDQLQTVWDSLRTSNAVRAKLWRGDAQVTLEFTVDPPVGLPLRPVPAQVK